MMAADARAELRNRFVGLHVQDIDRQRAADDLGFTKAQARELRDLGAGQFSAYGPALSAPGIVKLQIDLPHRVARLTDCQVKHVAVPERRPEDRPATPPPARRPMLERVASLMRTGTRSGTA